MSKVCFLFPGQGAQAIGMGRRLAESIPAVRRLYEQASQSLGYDLAEICWNGPLEKLNSTVISQPAIYVTSLAALETLRAAQPAIVDQCAACAGLSLGEYTALTFAGALSFDDGLKVVRRRGEAMQEASDATPSGMVSVLGLDTAQAEEICSVARAAGPIDVANLLCPGNCVISGTLAACEAAEREAVRRGARTVRLPVAGAFHTAIMRPADQALAAALAEVHLQRPRLPIWSNVDARPHTDTAEIRDLLVRQVLQPVRWEDTMRHLLADGFDLFYEIGPARVLAGLLKRVHRRVECHNITA